WYGNGTVAKNGTIGTIGNNNGDYSVDICLIGASIITCGTFSTTGGASHNIAIVGWNSNCVPTWNATWGQSGYEMTISSMWKSGNSIFTCGDRRDMYGNLAGILAEFTASGVYVSSKTYAFATLGQMCAIAGDSSAIYTAGTMDVNSTVNDYDIFFIKWTKDSPGTEPGVSGYPSLLLVLVIIATLPVLILKKSRKRL
ncbi:MAG: hypothetical protein Q6373_018360, partial [Candidatus Sigynarchaeota archaeon]